LRGVLCVGGLAEVLRELVELSFPESSVCFHPSRGLAQRARLEPAAAHPAIALDAGKPGTLENAEVFRHGGEGHGERLRQIADGRVACGESGEDGAPRGVGERRERQVELRV
jgi:hypothetical protein